MLDPTSQTASSELSSLAEIGNQFQLLTAVVLSFQQCWRPCHGTEGRTFGYYLSSSYILLHLRCQFVIACFLLPF